MKINKLHSSIPLTIIEVLAAAIVIYALLYTIVTLTPLNLGVMQLYNKIFITGNSIYAPYMLSLFKHLICLIPGIIISFVISLFRFTSVTVTDTKIIIRQSFNLIASSFQLQIYWIMRRVRTSALFDAKSDISPSKAKISQKSSDLKYLLPELLTIS